MRPFQVLRDAFWRSTRSWISAAGVVLTTISAISILVIFALELMGQELSNYTGILTYVILPGIFAVGLILVPIGLARVRKAEREGRTQRFPVFDLNDPKLRTVALIVGALTVVNLAIVSASTYKGLEVMHSDEFCGGTCHNVMEPEAVAHRVTAHAQVYCADCHIGEGADHFVNAKLRGAGQMLQFLTGDVTRPVPQPTDVRTAVCVRCHATNRFAEDRLHIRKMYADDETSTEKTTVWRMLVGGLRDGEWKGAHKHVGMNVRYLADATRGTITEVEVHRPDGTDDRFVVKDAKTPEGATWHTMGCTDCHSRPAHRFTPAKTVVEKALARGAIDRELPFIYREALTALKASYPSHEAARQSIPMALADFYAKQMPGMDAAGKTKVAAAGKVLAEAWTQNNFPDMKVAWGSYTDFYGHEPGCFRCHDKKHENAKGAVIQKSCGGSCHDIIATEEAQPEIVDVLYP